MLKTAADANIAIDIARDLRHHVRLLAQLDAAHALTAGALTDIRADLEASAARLLELAHVEALAR